MSENEFQSDTGKKLNVNESILNVWERWKSEDNQNEKRIEAFEEIKNCKECLYLVEMHLSTLPSTFPYGLKKLILKENKLTLIPENLPETLEILDISNNKLFMITGNLPSNLEELLLGHNNIINVPNTLPDSIIHLQLYRNSITTLPNKLPRCLKLLDIHSNKLCSLPENLFGSLKSLQILQMKSNNLTKIKLDSESLIELDLGNNEIEAIEFFNLPKLQYLDVKHNNLTNLPNLSQTLEYLYASSNKLSVIFELPNSLKALYLDSNNISILPKPLPLQLKELSLHNNKITEIPTELPTSLTYLGLTNNLIIDINSRVKFPTNAIIDLDENPLSETSIEYLKQLIRTGNPPTICFDDLDEYYENYVKTRSLAEEVPYWLEDELVDPCWNLISEESGATSFSYFLYRIRQSVFFVEPMKGDISKWLYSMGEENNSKRTLRELIFFMATEEEEKNFGPWNAMIRWTWNQMKLLEVVLNVESGKYDNKIEELIELARGIYRLNLLEQITRRKLQKMNQQEEIECNEYHMNVDYQIRLKDILELPIRPYFWPWERIKEEKVSRNSEKASWYSCFALSNKSIEQAIKEINEKEQTEFISFLLIDWQPWKEVLKRWNYEKYISSENDVKNEEIFCQALDKRKTEFIIESNMSDLPLDIEIQLGTQVQRDIAKDIWYKLTNEFLETKQLHLRTLV
ncbi:probable E3 ubiquitin-protein ligase NGR_a03640 [Chrysoperla carnea]|uniref:probable E3 ubiquitin-protein ligase NGR_a03640 n=1 Tax=Chrysoperla carnea TaxID=189513 RepID=UPI001D061A89|nr:probable E3 ubiquitin-protein ligase NGR_a03640 [Chrysoperla carnea]